MAGVLLSTLQAPLPPEPLASWPRVPVTLTLSSTFERLVEATLQVSGARLPPASTVDCLRGFVSVAGLGEGLPVEFYPCAQR